VPDLTPGRRVERENAREWRAEIEHAVDNERRRLERRAATRSISRLGRFAGAEGPHLRETADVLARDLRERREAVAK
jgi:hypothetical protein